MKYQRLDSISLDQTYYTEEGYLVDHPIVTTCGIFEYKNEDGSVRRELRLPDDVFDEKSLKSYKGKPIIITHDAGEVSKDNVRRELMEVQQNASKILQKAERAVSVAGKQIEKTEKKQVKADCDNLRKLLTKIKPDKVTEFELNDVKSATSRLEASAANVIRVFEMMDNEAKNK